MHKLRLCTSPLFCQGETIIKQNFEQISSLKLFDDLESMSLITRELLYIFVGPKNHFKFLYQMTDTKLLNDYFHHHHRYYYPSVDQNINRYQAKQKHDLACNYQIYKSLCIITVGIIFLAMDIVGVPRNWNYSSVR